MPVKDWYSIQAKKQGDEQVAEVRIYDEIGFWGTTAKSFVERLSAVIAESGATRILVSINSPGGSVFDAFAIYNALRRNDLPVTTRVDGVAASAASMIFMAGDERVMPENAMLMVHNMWIVAVGTADELRNTADMMDKARAGAVAAYARSGQPEAEIIRMLDETTWMDALEAQSLGFATLMEEPVKIAASANAASLLEMLPGMSADLLAKLQNPEPPADDPPPPNDPPADPPPEPTPPQPPEPTPPDAKALTARVFSECRAQQVPHLAEGILMSTELTDAAAVDTRIQAAVQIAGVCLAARVPDLAAKFVSDGLGVDQVRARLFEQLHQADRSQPISNLQRPPNPQNSAPASRGPNPSAIYAARKATPAR